MAKKKSVRSRKPAVPPPVVLFVAEVEGWTRDGQAWKMLTMVRPSLELVRVKRELLRYARKRERWMAHYGVSYRIRAYTRVEGKVVDDEQLHEAMAEEMAAEKTEAAEGQGVTA